MLLAAEVHEGTEVPESHDGAPVLLADLQRVDGDRRVAHVLVIDGRVRRATVGIFPSDLECAIHVPIDDLARVHVAIVWELGIDDIPLLVVVEDDLTPHELRVGVGHLVASIPVIPLHLEGAIIVDLGDGSRMPRLFVRGHGFAVVADLVILVNDDLLEALRAKVVGLVATIGIIPTNNKSAIAVVQVDPAKVPALVLGRLRLDLVADLVLHRSREARRQAANPAAGRRAPTSKSVARGSRQTSWAD
mmetsp:Transcript_155913/g.499872  ORF Transcript_155913/g.499872 Transcript_155913/m.499872 type:complete len:247 (+) Transcript_155913:902-1642(+)